MAQSDDDSNPGDAIPDSADDTDGVALDGADELTVQQDHSADVPPATLPLDPNRVAASGDLDVCDEPTLADDHLRGSASDATLIVAPESLGVRDSDETAVTNEDGSSGDGTHHRPSDGSAAYSPNDSSQPGDLTLAENDVDEGRSGSAKIRSPRPSGRATEMEDPSGDHFIQRYRFVEEIGRGGMG